MDLKELSPTTDDLVIELKHPATKETIFNDDGTPMTITVYSPFSKEAKVVLHDIADKRLAEATKTGSTRLKASDFENFSLEGLSRTTRSWNITWAGEKPEFTVDLAREIYAAAFWIKDQIEEKQNSTVNFMKG